jgi:CheY-like chemotaxis protein
MVESKVPAATPWRLAIADDDGEMRAWLRLALRPLTASVVEVGSGVALLDVISEQGPFDAVITDVRMPGPSGLNVIAMARTAGLETPFLVITAFPDAAVYRLVDRLSATEILAKPFQVGDLRTAVRGLIEGVLE